MRSLLTLLACQPLAESHTRTDVTDPPEGDARTAMDARTVATVRMPEGSAIVRECYARPEADRRRYGARPKAGTGGSSTRSSTSAAPPPPATAPAPMTAAEPALKEAPGPSGGLAALGYGGGGPGEGAADDAALARAPKREERKADTTTSKARANDEKQVAQPAAADAAPMESEAARSSDGDDKMAGPRRVQAQRPPEPQMDWGATVYLSNDDSMSLASAQRLLWAVQNKGSVSAGNIRPHEFLNYFSFDTRPVTGSDTFSVLASAEKTDDDTLTMAFAVRGASPPHQPLDLTLVLDRSGSMTAEGRMEYLKRGLDKMSGQLQRGDRVDLVLFDNEVCTPLENWVKGRDDDALLASAISSLEPRGSTDLDAGLREGYRIANARTDGDGRNRRMLLISDALLNTGEIDQDVVSEIGKAYESSGVRLSAVGVGRDFNDSVLDMLCEKGKGAYVYLGSEAVVDRIFGPGFESLTRTIAHDVHFALDLPPSLAMERFYGEEASTTKEDVQPIHYYAGTTQLFLQDLKLKDRRAVTNDPVTLTVEWTDATTGRARTQQFESTVGRLMDADGRNLHKARALMSWTDMIRARSMGQSPCGAPFQAWQDRVDALGEDAEIAWLDGMTSPLCGSEPVARTTVRKTGVPYKVKVDSDQIIAEVSLSCQGERWTDSLGGADTVARFDAATPGSCELVLYGAVPMVAQVKVPQTGGDVRCTVRGGRITCS
jgi:Ca-activated chloride channel family protein